MHQYTDLIRKILAEGRDHKDRTGVGRKSLFGYQMRFNLAEGFPLLTNKFTAIRPIIHELLWFLSGDTNIKYLLDNDVHIWNSWIDPEYAEVPLSYAEILKNIEDAVLWTNEQHLVQVFKEVDGVLTKEVIPPEEVTADMAAYAEIVELAIKTGLLHHMEIKTTKQVLVGGSIGGGYGKMWRSWPDDVVIGSGSEERYEAMGYSVFDRVPSYDRSMDDSGQCSIMRREIDQIAILIENLKKNPFSARHVISGWNPGLLPEEGKSHAENVRNGKQALPPCHTLFQFFVEELTPKERQAEAYRRGYDIDDSSTHDIVVPEYRLSCQLYQRSADCPAGVPFNIASYALLTMMIAQCVDMVPGEFVHTLGDAHIYLDQIESMEKMLTQKEYDLPAMKINPAIKDINSFKFEDFELVGYKHGGKIFVPVAV